MSLAVVYSVFRNNSTIHPILRKTLMGLMVSVIVVFIMLGSFVLVEVDEGIMFDARAIIISVSGMFFGLIPTVMGVIAATTVRAIQGGVGMVTGIFWIFVSGALGLIWRKFRLKRTADSVHKITWLELYIYSLFIQIVMILLLFILPSPIDMETINLVAFPILVVYPIGGLFVSQFLLILRKQYFTDANTSDSERQYRMLFSKNRANLLLVNSTTGEIVDANEACVQTYGYSVDNLKKLTISDLNTLPHEDVMFDFISARENKKNYFIYKHIKKSGKVFDVEMHTSKVLIENKEYIYLTIIDISEKLQSERLFKDADERLKTTLLSVAEGVVVTDEYARITLVNQKAKALLNSTGSLERKKVFDELRIYSNQSNETFEDIYKRCVSENIKFLSDSTYTLIKGEEDSSIFIDFTVSPINNEYGVNHGAIIVFRDVTIEKERQEEIRFMSRHDYLTKLYNRYNFETEIKRLDTKRQLPISLIIGDINGLKLVNDAFGHLEGDRLLTEVADIFRKATRSEDIVARWGGDEFSILLPQTSEEGALSVINRIKDLCSKSMYDLITPSISIGYATKVSPDQNIIDVLTSAEEMMYNKKINEGPAMREQLLNHLMRTINSRIKDNLSHTNNMIDIANNYFDYYNVSQDERNKFISLITYHDIGRVGIDDKILNKTTPLTEYDWTKIKTHPEIGSRLIATIPELQSISSAILEHHERWDGTGYPQGLKGNNISEMSRLLLIFDAYETIVFDKVYKGPNTHDEAINEILKHTGKQFDPDLVSKFIKIFETQKKD